MNRYRAIDRTLDLIETIVKGELLEMINYQEAFDTMMNPDDHRQVRLAAAGELHEHITQGGLFPLGLGFSAEELGEVVYDYEQGDCNLTLAQIACALANGDISGMGEVL